MNRKESIGRLLITLLTAFIMVVGVFGTAVYTNLSNEAAPEVPLVASELDEETREIGEAPISANTDEQADTLIGSFSGEAGETLQPTVMTEPVGDLDEEITERQEIQTSTATEEATPTFSGTRAASVEAYGPYGTITDPKYEGESILFESDIVGGNNVDYKFRWDVNGDGIPDGPGTGAGAWGAWGETNYNHEYLDNMVGEAMVEAWDGSMTTISVDGTIFDEASPYWYMSWYYYMTWGHEFDVNEDCTVDQIGMYRTLSAYPYYCYNLRLWEQTSTTTGTLIASYSGTPGYMPSGWNWYSITPTPLEGGKTYVVSAYIRGYIRGLNNPGETPDGVMESRWTRGSAGSGNVFPYYRIWSTYSCFIDVHYEQTVDIPNVIFDTADVFVDNVAPIPLNPQAIPSVGQEGADVGFTGSFMDPGLDDDWEYRWDFGDGTQSPWRSVSKYAGGASVLILHAWGSVVSATMDAITAADTGNFINRLEEHSYAPGQPPSANPTFDYMMEFDVIVIGSNYYYGDYEGIGDMLADYSDLKGAQGSGGVVMMSFGWYGADPGIAGRWRSDDYDALDASYSLVFGTLSMGTVFYPSHPIMDGVTTLSAYYKNGIYTAARGIEIAQYTNGIVLAAAYQNPSGSGALHADLNYLPNMINPSGDWGKLMVNAIKWTSRQPDPTPLQMPIQLDPVYHTYADDEPTTWTPQDTFDAQLQVRDDDHESIMIIGGEITLLTEDFSSFSVPPPGWTKDPNTTNWRLYFSNYAGGTYPEARFYYWPSYNDEYRLYSNGFSTVGYSNIEIRWRHYIDHYGGPYTLKVETSADAVNWDTAWQLVNPGDTGATQMSQATTLNVGATTYVSWTFDGLPWNINWWHIDDLEVVTYEAYEMVGLGTAGTDVTIANVFPSVIVPGDFDDLVDEYLTIDFAGFELTDPAINERTEEFWYRWDYGDGTPVGPWIYKGTIAPPDLKVLVLNSFGVGEDCVQVLQDTFDDMGMGPYVTIDDYNFGPTGSNTIPSLSYMLDYDVIIVSMNYYIFNTGMVNDLGNKLADYSDAGGGVIQMTFSAGTYWFSQVAGRWMAEGYNPISYAPNHYGYVSLGDVYDPDHPIMEDVADMNSYYKHGTSGITSGATRLADYANGFTLCAYTDLDHHAPGGGRVIGLNYFPWFPYVGGDGDRMMANAVLWAWGAVIPTPVLDTVSHDYGDNGIYNAGLQIIDDDMMWQFGGTQPVFTGPGDPNDWISFDYFPVEVLNVDPEISPLHAEVNLDLVIRTTGEPNNDCVMTLWEGTTELGSVTVYHEGSYKMETLPATLDMGKINDYSVTVEYTNADPDGANPTWVFQGRFASGHIKELKNVFKEDGTIWTIDASLLKDILLGEDIIFTADGSDDGSDDLAFNWQFGDGEEGVHVYANADLSMEDGVSAPPENIFDAHPGRDPWFDRSPNTIRSPEMNPIHVDDEIGHAFAENGFYYVSLIVMDDDVCDGYPSFQTFLNGGGYDMEFIAIDLL